MDIELQARAAMLADYCREGRTADAYGVLKSHRLRDVQSIALGAGFACIPTNPQREFMKHLTHQVAEACRRRTDGHGLRHQLAREGRVGA